MKLARTTVAALLASVVLAGHAFAQFMLDSRFTDADGDLIADIPTDASQLVDPDTLIFAYTPVEDPAVYAEVWTGFLEHMEEVPGACMSRASTPAPIRSRSPAPASGPSP
jgi:phosphonate transport system substrate-binding protein